MRAVLVDISEEELAERRSIGADRRDEMWEGVLHMVPPAGGPHQRLGGELFVVLSPLAKAKGLVASYETGQFRTKDDYRVPDQTYCSPELTTERGVDGPTELLVEIRSEGDETYLKLDWYAAQGVAEVLVVHPADRTVELFVLRGERMALLQPDSAGEVRSAVLETGFRTVEGRLHIRWPGGSAVV